MDYDYTGTSRVNPAWSYTPSVTTTTSIPKLTIDGDSIKINNNEFCSESINLNGEKITTDDIKFIHTLKENKDQEEGSIMKNFNFGPCGDRAKLSHLGIAVQNTNGEWVSYDKENNEIVNVDLVNFGCNNFIYMIPAAIKDINVGDAIVHNHHVMFVVKARKKVISVIDITDGEIKKILPTKSIFGFDFVTKIVSLIDFTASTANEENPFGDILPFLLLNNNDNKGNNMFPLIFMLMNQNKENDEFFSSFSSTQIMLMAMMSNNTQRF